MQTLVFDVESYLDKDVTLKKLPTIQYVRHPLFKVHGAAIKVANDPAFWVTGKDLPAYFDELDWAEIIAISHNSLFDMLVLYEKYGKRPAQRIDTLGLARALLPADMDFDLDSLGIALGFGGKTDGGRIIQKIKGIRDLPPELEAELAPYAINDAEKEYKFFELLYPHLPEVERRLLDLTIRMGTEGILRFNHATASEARKEADDKRNARIANSGLDTSVLRSGPKFAEELRKRGVEPPMKKSEKKTATARAADPNAEEVYTYAFSKSDRAFLDLLDNPEVAHLCDGRLAAMSSGDIKRIDRLLAITGLPPYTIPMPLNYCGAHTTRWSGGGGINVQNLKKGADGKAGKLRESFEAPPGHVINVADSSQIELRLNMWFCGQNDILEMLRNGEDVYSYVATKILRKAVDKSMKKERQFGKIVELGCFAGDTLVLTDVGLIPITQMQPHFRVWDGTAWVIHGGLLWQGVKTTINVAGVRVTPDHQILCGSTWRPASDLAQNASILSQALETGSANLPSLVSSSARGAASPLFSFTVRAEQPNTRSTPPIFSGAEALAATRAQKSKPGTGVKNIWATLTLWLTARTESGCLTESPLVSSDATTPKTPATQTMEGAASAYTSPGAKIAVRFSRTWFHWMAGIVRSWSWIASTWTKGTNRATSASSQKPTTSGIGGRFAPYKPASLNSKQKLPVYDLLNCGPRNRFTIWTDAGPLVVHNCGYQMGWRKFKATCAIGPMGNPPIFLTNEEAKDAVFGYREAHPFVVAMWDWLGRFAIPHMADKDCDITRGPITFKHERIELPNGLALLYPNLRFWTNDDTGDSGWIYGVNGVKHKIYAGLALENIIQALARIVVGEQLDRIDREIEHATCVSMTHDENIAVSPEEHAEEVQRRMLEIMSTPPAWAPDLPVKAEGGYAKEYSK